MYEAMKVQLLNASHQSLCYFAYLVGYRVVHQAAHHPAWVLPSRGLEFCSTVVR